LLLFDTRLLCMTEFTPLNALIGGLLIGSSAILLLWLNGRIAGVTGMITGLLVKPSTAPGWRLLFLIGLVAGTALYGWLGYSTPQRQGFPLPLLIFAGLLTGYGTAQANGCTSGHGVCGMARLSVRSFVATGTFLAVAIITTYVLRHVAGVAA
jgi:uncharacterized membrane protein YedE/YeeE